MKRSFLTIALFCLGLHAGAHADEGAAPDMTDKTRIAVTIENVTPGQGTVEIGVYTQDQWLDDSFAGKSIAVEGSAISVSFDVPMPGRYGLAVYQDIDGNGKMNRGMMGLPSEPYGFSNDAPIRFGPPKWDAAAIEVAAGETVETTITLRD